MGDIFQKEFIPRMQQKANISIIDIIAEMVAIFS